MDCAEIRKILPDYTVGGLEEHIAAHVRAHLQECESCRRELRALENTGALLAPMQATDPPRDLWPAIRSQLEPRARRKPAWRVYWKPAVAMAAAAVILLAVLLAWPVLQAPAPLTPDLPVLAMAEGTTYAETQIAAAWDQPLADEASLALAMAVIEPENAGGAIP